MSLVAAVGDDETAEAALSLLEEAGVDLSRCWMNETLPTGVAVILVDSHGENLIAVAPGANRSLTAEALELGGDEAVICQLEIPIETVQAAAASTTGFFCLNAAPARTVPKEVLKRADLVVVNEVEHATLGVDLSEVRGLVALTLGSAGATLYRHGRAVAKATPPRGGCGRRRWRRGLLRGCPDREPARWPLARARPAESGHRRGPGHHHRRGPASMPTRAEVDALSCDLSLT